ncbi:MAG TPA: alcohol dehydrogenase catalytic domain-containing protein [Gaiellaceae bacterium]|nr:alcohol dehydrogenase catalytic domain-containing protein [Gaiellaceae bacterium]
MAAAVVAGPRAARRIAAPRPEPASGQVLVRVEGCGVCGSSLPVWEGRPWFEYPLAAGAPGHEVWGRLEDGTRVAALCFNGYAEWDVADEDTVVELPAALDGLPFPGEALACAVNVVERSGLHMGTHTAAARRRMSTHVSPRIAVVGMGFLGTCIARIIGEVTEVRRDTPVEGEFDVVVEAAGTQSALDTASRLVATGGTLVIAGFHQDGPRTVDLQSWNWRGLDVVNAHERDPHVVVRGMRSAVALAVAGVLDLRALVTDFLPLAGIADAFELARRRPPGFVKAVVCP